ncbi:hypothetical protein BDA99DRAFT_554091 [Phascolomyces articulosus]|uniref:Uncharacterized protein n=1 Tax=Phascolomyces articulosus TaxID=60185 RepID=A0AAD5KC17_9FUNG|nr:hypothetical protein BDA99DRAFT_554091 [Phascolomyces articulosus]
MCLDDRPLFLLSTETSTPFYLAKDTIVSIEDNDYKDCYGSSRTKNDTAPLVSVDEYPETQKVKKEHEGKSDEAHQELQQRTQLLEFILKAQSSSIVHIMLGSQVMTALNQPFRRRDKESSVRLDTKDNNDNNILMDQIKATNISVGNTQKQAGIKDNNNRNSNDSSETAPFIKDE